MASIQKVYSILLAQSYATNKLFRDLIGGYENDMVVEGAICPFCGTDLFYYSKVKPVWECWNCNSKGDWIDYLGLVEHLSSQEAAVKLALEAGVLLSSFSEWEHNDYTLKAKVLEDAQSHYAGLLSNREYYGDIRHPMDDSVRKVRDYVFDLGYTLDDIYNMELGSFIGPDYENDYIFWDPIPLLKFVGLLTPGFGSDYQLVFLMKDISGRAIGLVGQSIYSSEKLAARRIPRLKYSEGLMKGQSLIGLNSVALSDEIILVKGFLDALYLNTKGFKAVALDGSTLSPTQILALKEAGCKQVYIAMDMNEEGQKTTERIVGSLANSGLGIKVVSVHGFKDPDEMVRKIGPDGLTSCLLMAVSVGTC